MKGFAWYLMSSGSGRNRISRVVLSTVYRSDVSRIRARPALHSAPLASISSPVAPSTTGRIISAKPMPRNRWIRLVRAIWTTKPMIDR